MLNHWETYTIAAPPIKRRKVLDNEWNIYKHRILDLYLNRGLKLDEVRKTICAETGFCASVAMYKHRLRLWAKRDGIPMKNITLDIKQKKALASTIQERKKVGKACEIRSKDGRTAQKQDRILRTLGRFKKSSDWSDVSEDSDEAESPRASPTELFVATPTPDNPASPISTSPNDGSFQAATWLDLMDNLPNEVPRNETTVKQFTCRVGDIKIATIPVHSSLDRQDLERFDSKKQRSQSTSAMRQFFEVRKSRKRKAGGNSLVCSQESRILDSWDHYSPRHPTTEECIAICLEASELLHFVSTVFKHEEVSVDFGWDIKTDEQLSDEHFLTWLQLEATRKVAQGCIKSAIESFENVLHLQESHPKIGKNHRDTLFQLKAIAALYAIDQQPLKAVHWYRRMIDLQIRLQGESHFDTIQTVGGLLDELLLSGIEAESSISELRHLLYCCERCLLEDWDKRRTNSILKILRRCCENIWSFRAQPSSNLNRALVSRRNYKRGNCNPPLFLQQGFTTAPCLKDVFFDWCDRILRKLCDRRRTYMAPFDYLELLVTKFVVIKDLREEFLAQKAPPLASHFILRGSPKALGISQRSTGRNIVGIMEPGYESLLEFEFNPRVCDILEGLNSRMGYEPESHCTLFVESLFVL